MVDDVYLDDHERAERVKKWWKQNAPAIIAGAVLGLAAIFGWRAWETHQVEQARAAAMHYDRFLSEAQALSVDEVRQRVGEFQSEYGGTPYGALAALEGAVLLYRNARPEPAAEYYRYAIRNGSPAEVRDVARLRLARLQMDMGRFDAALDTLAEIKPQAFLATVAELRGDIYVQQGRQDEARRAYETARDVAEGFHTRFLDLKIASLGSGVVGPATREDEA